MRVLIAVLITLLVPICSRALNLNIQVTEAGNLINQVDLSKVEEVDSLTISGDLNGTDILVIRKMLHLSYLDMQDANIVSGGQSYYTNYTASENTIGAHFLNQINQLKLDFPIVQLP